VAASVSAGQFVQFAFVSARRKRTLARDAVRRAAGDARYITRQDYWYQLRLALQRAIKSGDLGPRALSASIAKFPKDRRHRFTTLLTSFAQHWPAYGAQGAARPILTPNLQGLDVRSIPHAAVHIGPKLYYVRFAYGSQPPRDPQARLAAHLLRECALRARAWPAILLVESGALVAARRDPQSARMAAAEAAEFMRLWRQFGGR
jgi:hypothetical protein